MIDARVVASAVALGIVLALAPAGALAAPEAISVRGGWAAFRDEGRCYAISAAEPSPLAREHQPFASVTMDGAAPAFQMRLSRSIASGAVVTLDVGERRFRLAGEGAGAQAMKGQNARIAAALRSNPTMTVGARDRQGRYFRDRYRLAGAPTAMDAAMIACGAS